MNEEPREQRNEGKMKEWYDEGINKWRNKITKMEKNGRNDIKRNKWMKKPENKEMNENWRKYIIKE